MLFDCDNDRCNLWCRRWHHNTFYLGCGLWATHFGDWFSFWLYGSEYVGSILTDFRNMVADKKHTVWLAIGAAIAGVIGKRLFVFIKLSISAEGILGAIQSVLLVLLTLGTFVYMLYRPCIQTKKSEAFP